jgi:hypothetical protein
MTNRERAREWLEVMATKPGARALPLRGPLAVRCVVSLDDVVALLDAVEREAREEHCKECAELESALLDCQRYVLDNGIDVARSKIAGRVSEVLR